MSRNSLKKGTSSELTKTLEELTPKSELEQTLEKIVIEEKNKSNDNLEKIQEVEEDEVDEDDEKPQTVEGTNEANEEEKAEVEKVVTMLENEELSKSRASRFKLADHYQFAYKQEQQFKQKYEQKIELTKESLLDRARVPESYYQNSEKEVTCLNLIENFRRQYFQMFSDRRELLLTPNNEFGIPKFVCTTIRPTQLNYNELYDYRGCAKFIADHIAYEPLDPPYDLPKVLNSPSFTLELQKGNSLDMSVLLVSLLRGAGYDAYVLSGYATKIITTKDQTNIEYLVDKEPKPKRNSEMKKEQPVADKKENKYKLRPAKTLQSVYLQTQEAKLKQLTQEEKEESTDMPIEEPKEIDEYLGLRIHFWVLVLPGKREVSEPFFIESTTGKISSTEDSNYMGVECAFNSVNYWVNKQPCLNGLKDISFDLGNYSQWEYVFQSNSQPDIVSSEDDFEPPSSWVMKLEIPKRKFELRAPHGYQIQHYKNVIVETYAPYVREDGMTQRLILLSETYKLDSEPVVEQIQELFQNRKDKLQKRVKWSNSLIVEHFGPSRLNGLKKFILNGSRMELEFYLDARADGLVKRIDEPHQLVELYEEREDLLRKRKATFELANHDRTDQLIKVTEKYLKVSNDSDFDNENIYKKRFYIKEERLKMIYHLNNDRLTRQYFEFQKPAGEQMNVTDLATGYDPNPRGKTIKKQDIHALYYKLLRMEYLALQNIRNAEREFRDILQGRYQEEEQVQLTHSYYDVIHHREEVQKKVQNELLETKKSKSINQILKSNTSSELLEKADEKTDHVDYLSPFLLLVKDPQNMKREEALQVKEACLRALKDRLIEKANIMQTRIDQEAQLYQQKQLEYSQRQQQFDLDTKDAKLAEEEEKYKKWCHESLFKMNILEKRLVRHKELAPEKYMQLDKKLKNDQRLSKLLHY